MILLLKGALSVEIFDCRWNSTAFGPDEHPEIKICTDELLRNLDVGDVLTYRGNRDKVMHCPYDGSPNLFTWVTCSSALASLGECQLCLASASSMMKQCCSNSCGVYVNSTNCAVRYETYDFTI
ncbi:hypothetical protein LINGRAHAP2_LOCUS16346 [Linum grandiflorum]